MEKIIIAQIAGGLGNQLFQYAFARNVASETDAKLLLDVSFNTIYTTPKRELDLLLFPIHAEILSNVHLETLPNEINMLEETCNLFYEDIDMDSLEFPLFLSGYRQSWKYFVSIEKMLRTELCFENSKFPEKVMALSELIANTCSVGIHIRRTDYAQNPHLGMLPNSYYYQAVNYLKQKNDEFRFYIFSDDPAWVEAALDIPESFQIIKGNNGFEDFYLMSQCRNNIIANSSYSWWAAWLNQNPAKIVVAPRFWKLGENLDVTKTDLIPPEWITLWS